MFPCDLRRDQVKEEAKEKGRLLPENHPAALLVRKVSGSTLLKAYV